MPIPIILIKYTQKQASNYTIMKLPSKWFEVVQRVEGANLASKQQQRVKSQFRNQEYIQDIKQQISLQIKTAEKKKQLKSFERRQIEDAVKKQNELSRKSKLNKMKTQQKYRADNLELYKSSMLKPRQYSQPKQSPFIKLVDTQDERMRQTKNKFIEQNKFNDIQIEIKKNQSNALKQKEKQQRAEYESYVQQTFKERDQRQKKLKIKYLKPNKQKTLNHQDFYDNYRSFLDQQVDTKNQKRRQEKYDIDMRQRAIHASPEISNSSPAYLGRDIFQSDRQRQLNIIDKALNKSRKFRGAKQNGLSLSQNITENICRQKVEEPKTIKTEVSVDKNLKLPVILKPADQKNPQRYVGSSLDVKTEQNSKKPAKQYCHYDFISGRKKVFLI